MASTDSWVQIRQRVAQIHDELSTPIAQLTRKPLANDAPAQEMANHLQAMKWQLSAMSEYIGEQIIAGSIKALSPAQLKES